LIEIHAEEEEEKRKEFFFWMNLLFGFTCPPKSQVRNVIGPNDVRGVLSYIHSDI
jgi:hypothetical protein